MMVSNDPRVRDIMGGRRQVKTAYYDSNVTKAVDVLEKNNIGCVVVIDNTGPMAIFTERETS